MGTSIDYYFTSGSPFAYLGHQKLMEIADRFGKRIDFRPFDISGVWGNSGSVPLPQRSLARQQYRFVELQRIAEFRGMEITLQPKYFPTNPTLADLTICALQHLQLNPAEFAYRIGKALWVDNQDVADRNIVSTLLNVDDGSPDKLIELAETDAIAQIRIENTEKAIQLGVIGAPAYVYKDEVFWGQDRLEYLEHMIKSDRPAFSSPV